MYPKMGYKLTMYPKYPTWGTDGVQKVALRKIHTFVAYLKKFEKFDYPHFLVGLIYRWGKGLKTKNDEKKAKIDENHQKLMKMKRKNL